MGKRINNLIADLTHEINLTHNGLLEKFPIEKYIAELNRYDTYAGYRYVSDEVKGYCEAIEYSSNLNILENYHKLLVVQLIENATGKIESLKFPNAIKKFYLNDFDRILLQAEKEQEHPNYFLYTNDRFYKDLGICCLRLFPVGARKYELAKFPIKRFLKKGYAQFVNLLIFIAFRARGLTPFLTGHYDTEDPNFKSEFNVEGSIFAYRMIARVMRMNPDIKGYFGINWINDPQIERISPRLAFVRYVNVALQCKYFYLGPNNSAIKNATKLSKTRRRLYQAGEYLPENFAFVFTRKQLIAWDNKMTWHY